MGGVSLDPSELREQYISICVVCVTTLALQNVEIGFEVFSLKTIAYVFLLFSIELL